MGYPVLTIVLLKVAYDELNVVGAMLQKDNLDPSQKETAIALIQRLQRTGLFSILENSIEGVSLIIAELLNSTLSSETETCSYTIRKNDLDGFDIGEFV